MSEDNNRKRHAEDDESDDRQNKSRRTGFIIKMLCPFWCAGAVIGTGGEEIKQLKEKTGVSIKVSKNFENFPTTNERVVSMQGDLDPIKECILYVQNKIRNDQPPSNAPQRDNSKRKGCLKLIVAGTSAGRIIGKGGSRAKQFKNDLNVHINVTKASELPPGLDESPVTLEGDAADLDNCVCEIVDLIAEDPNARMEWNVNYGDFSDKGGRGDGGYNSRGGSYGRDSYSGGKDNYQSGGGYNQSGYGGGYNQGRSGGYSQGDGGGYNSGYNNQGGGYGGGYNNSQGYNNQGYGNSTSRYNNQSYGGGRSDGYGGGNSYNNNQGYNRGDRDGQRSGGGYRN